MVVKKTNIIILDTKRNTTQFYGVTGKNIEYVNRNQNKTPIPYLLRLEYLPILLSWITFSEFHGCCLKWVPALKGCRYFISFEDQNTKGAKFK